ncbi:hypothetical protein M947_10865 [Sulfurimonas hongkongensis]|uniref:Uncharacterized protein n=1 Tax=Sulfurimonas hongkongensis TaxID=1172190 RepID=T0J0C0_9BACT|nr:hypothetical protein [Sulfurimonas hongkongensis]EQB34500.1 hypothetical protein M947_10865 [Sulfurimonas hongkongensis]
MQNKRDAKLDEVADSKWVKKVIKSMIIGIIGFVLIGVALAIFFKISIN